MQQTNNNPIETRHVVIQKGCAFGQLVLHIDPVRNATACFVPVSEPHGVPRLCSYETAAHARALFKQFVEIFKQNGWTPIHDGPPNFG